MVPKRHLLTFLPSIMVLILPAPQDICLCPLHTLVFDHIDVRWFTNTYKTETQTRCQVCYHYPPAPPSINSIHTPQVLQPFIFKLIGQITKGNCHLTTEGYRSQTEGLIVSCWVELQRTMEISGMLAANGSNCQQPPANDGWRWKAVYRAPMDRWRQVIGRGALDGHVLRAPVLSSNHNIVHTWRTNT